MKLLKPVIVAAALTLLASAAYAGDTTVSLPIGEWIGGSLDGLTKLFVTTAFGAVTWAGAHLGPQVAGLVKQYLTKQVVEQGVHYAIGAVKGATHGEKLDVDVTSRVVAEAAKYVIANAPYLAKRIDATLEPKIYAHLSSIGMLQPDTTARSAGAEVSVKIKSK